MRGNEGIMGEEKMLSDISMDDDDVDKDIVRNTLDELLRAHTYNRIEEILLQYKDITEHDNDLATVYYLMGIYKKEKGAGQKTILDKTGSVSALLERYTILKFYLRRIDFDVIGEGMQDFCQYVAQNNVSAYELLTVMDYSVVHKDKVLDRIKEIV